MVLTSPSISFPVPVLTPIVGRPNSTNLQVLQQQLYANARSVASDRGGGTQGHLALLMSNAAYLLRPGAIAFDIPVSPGILGVPPNQASSAQITDLKRVYENELLSFNTYQFVRTELVKQITTAVESTYLQTLCDADFGFADVTPAAMLTHLKTTYGVMTGIEIEKNRARLSEAWDTATPIENLWTNITEIRRIATSVTQAIGDTAVITLVLPMFERTGLFTHAVNSWNSMTVAAQTYDAFKTHFTRANELRVTALTSADVKYSNMATTGNFTITTPVTNGNVAVTPPRVARDVSDQISVSGNRFYYCWSHGLCQFENHTSEKCNHPKPGHITTATAFKRQGGSNIFVTKEDRTPRQSTTRSPTANN